MNNLSGIREFAKLTGVSPGTIGGMKKKKSPGLIFQGGKIVVDKSLEACRAYGLLKNSKLIWGSDGNSTVSSSIPKHDRKQSEDSSAETESQNQTQSPNDNREPSDDLGELIIQEKKQRIRKLEIDNEKEEGKLVYIDELESTWFELARRTRDSMLSIPARLAMKLVGKTAHEIEVELTEEIKFSLTNLPDDQPQPKESK